MPTTDLVPIAVYRTAVPGFIVRAGFCARPTCARPILHVEVDFNADGNPMTWCSKSCASWGRRKRMQAQRATERIAVTGRCRGCREWFTQVVHRNSATKTEAFCKERCKFWMPCEPCGGINNRASHRAICIECFTVIKRSCAGKTRYNKDYVERVVATRRRKRSDREATAYHCWAICGAWHIGAPIGEEHQNRIIAAAAYLRQRLGPDSWDRFVAELATAPRSEIVWLNGRTARTVAEPA